MSIPKKIVLFLSLVVIQICTVWLLFSNDYSQWLSVIREGRTSREYVLISAGEDGTVLTPYWESPKQLRFRFFDEAGKNVTEWQPALPAEATSGALNSAYPADRNTVFLSFYEDESKYLSVYRVTKSGESERILRLETNTVNVNPAFRRSALRIGSFSKWVDEVRFAILSEDQTTAHLDDSKLNVSVDVSATIYVCPVNGGGVRQITGEPWNLEFDAATYAADFTLTSVVLPTDKIVIGGDNLLNFDRQDISHLVKDQHLTRLSATNKSVFYLDAHSETLYHSELDGTAPESYMELDKGIDPSMMFDMTVTAQGNVLILQEGSTLMRIYPGGTQALTGTLMPTRLSCALYILATLAGAALVAAFVMYIIFTLRRGNIPMGLFYSLLLLAVAWAAASVLHEKVFTPSEEDALRDTRIMLIDSALANSLKQNKAKDEKEQLSSATLLYLVEQQSIPGMRRAYASVAHWSEEEGKYINDRREIAELERGFSTEIADALRKTGEIQVRQSESMFTYAFMFENQVIMITLEVRNDRSTNWVEFWVVLSMAAVFLIGMTAFIVIGAKLRYLGRGLERYSRQDPWKRLRTNSRDELEGIAKSLNSMAENREQEERERNRVVESYRRFLPERMVELLGKQTILDVDKNTYSSREMAVMSVRFYFPAEFYALASNIRLLFESVNTVIERTAPIATQRGGTVFNFAYDGYDVVMETDSARLIGTAVALQQEALAINEMQQQKGLPKLTFRVALDVGNVMLGIVGDSGQMEPSATSTCFSTLVTLIKLCEELDAGILCTEEISAGLEGYGSRYVGKCRTEDGVIRVYEIFDGDPYEMREEKASTLRRFSQGILDYYSGNLTQAKRTFLELAHAAPKDGAARHYLYLTDRQSGESGPPEELQSWTKL